MKIGSGKETLWIVFKVLLAIALIGYVFSKIELGDLGRTWQRLSLVWFIGDVMVFGAMTWSIARRYWILIAKQTTFRQLVGLVVVQTSIGNLLATSAGAASYAVLLRARYQVGLKRSIGSIVLARFLDMLLLFATLALSSWAIWSEVTSLHWFIAALLMLVLAIATFLATAFAFRRPLAHFMQKLLGHAHSDRILGIERIVNSMGQYHLEDTYKMRGAAEVITYSCLTFALSLVFAYCNVRIFAIPIGIWPILFIVSLTQLVALVPIQVLGGLGVFDVTVLYLYGLFGFSQAEMAPIVVGWRVISYILNLLLLLYLPIDSRLTSLSDGKLSPQ